MSRLTPLEVCARLTLPPSQIPPPMHKPSSFSMFHATKPPLSKRLLETVDQPSNVHLQMALQKNDPRTAWSFYKILYNDDKLDTIHPDDHTAILAHCSVSHTPFWAAIKASFVVKNMRELDIKLDQRDYAYLMTSHYRNKNDVHRVSGSFDDAIQVDKLQPSKLMYDILMISLSKAKLLDRVVSVYNDMCSKQRFAHLDPSSCGILLEAFAKCHQINDSVEIFNGFLQRIYKDIDIPNSLRERLTTLPLYESMIRAYGYNKNLSKALELFEKVKSNAFDRVSPQLSTFDAIIDAAAQCRDWTTSKRLWASINEYYLSRNKMISDNLKNIPTSYVFGSKLEERHYLFPQKPKTRQSKKLHTSAVYPSLKTYENLIKCAAQSGEMADVLSLFYTLVAFYPAPSTEIYEQVIRAYIRKGQIDLAKGWYEGSRKMGHFLPFDIINSLGDKTDAEQFLGSI